MGHKTPKGTVSLINYKGRIRLRWRFQSNRYSLNLSPYNKANLLPAKQIALSIEQDIANNKFDHSLSRYRGTSESKPIVSEKTIVQYFEEWTSSYKQMDCEKHTNYNSVRNMLRKWGKIQQSNVLGKFNAETFCGATYNRRLTMLKDFIKWLVKGQIWLRNPLEDISPKKYKKAKQPAKSDCSDPLIPFLSYPSCPV
jgi:integrase